MPYMYFVFSLISSSYILDNVNYWIARALPFDIKIVKYESTNKI